MLCLKRSLAGMLEAVHSVAPPKVNYQRTLKGAINGCAYRSVSDRLVSPRLRSTHTAVEIPATDARNPLADRNPGFSLCRVWDTVRRGGACAAAGRSEEKRREVETGKEKEKRDSTERSEDEVRSR